MIKNLIVHLTSPTKYQDLKMAHIIFQTATILILLLGSLLSACGQQKEIIQKPYTWKSVQIVGGGFVSGIVFHPIAEDVRYCRTDMGGAYRWNAGEEKWEPLLDWLSYEDRNLMGVESIALDPSNPDRVYLSCGTYTNPNTPNGAILLSDDRGETISRVDMPFKMGGNENGRGNGERMAVDPNNGNIIYLGTRHDGLWRSADRGKNWERVESFPNVKETPPDGSEEEQRRWRWRHSGSGIIFVVFDPTSGENGRSSTIYVGVSLMDRDNFFRSRDGGDTWEAVPGHPTRYRPTQGVLSSDGMMYLSYGTNPGPMPMHDGGVWRFDTKTGDWKEISPEKPDPENNRGFGYASVAVDAQHPQTIIASSFGRPDGEEIFRTTDSGQSWTPVFEAGGNFDFSLAPYVAFTPVHWLFDIEINPSNSDHALFTTGYGGYESFDLTGADKGKPTLWRVMSKGIEETVALDLLSPPEGPPLISAIGDYGGFIHRDLDKPAPEGNFDNPHFGNTNSIDCAAGNPDIIVRVGIASHHRGGGHIGYSLDGGKTWQPPASTPEPESKLGHIAVSTDGESWVWTPRESAVYVTRDRGDSWRKAEGIPDNMKVIADPVNPGKFYAVDLFGGRLFVSEDGGGTFSAMIMELPNGVPSQGFRGDPRGGQDQLYAAPNREGDLWLAAYDGLYRLEELAKEKFRFRKLPNVEEIHGYGFGKAAPGEDYPTLYLIGIIHNLRGIFKSDDKGKTWIRINDDEQEWGLLLHITGDPKKYGRVYVGTHGRGILYGDPK